MDTPLKRKRTPNFSAEEKLQFLRLLQEMGQVIITKTTCHDITSNKAKEKAWDTIAQNLNASGNIVRTSETLKKLWQKLKSDGKTYKSRALIQATGTGGGPSKQYFDPVMELVGESTGRGTSGIENVQDCDSDLPLVDTDRNAKAVITETAIDNGNQVVMLPENEIFVITDKSLEDNKECGTPIISTPVSGVKWFKRRQPVLSEHNERTVAMKARSKLNNSFAAERLRAEREKTELILTQKKQMTELHAAKMANERLKKELLETLINEVSDGKTEKALKLMLNEDSG